MRKAQGRTFLLFGEFGVPRFAGRKGIKTDGIPFEIPNNPEKLPE
jgi:hypothetical protein